MGFGSAIISLIVAFGLLFSSASGFAKSKKEAGKTKFIRAEAVTNKDSKSVNFGEVDISGEAKTPALDMISTNSGRSDYGFIKIRLNWNNEMINTATNLDREIN